jgi:uncharacterized protein (DUF1810 family)
VNPKKPWLALATFVAAGILELDFSSLVRFTGMESALMIARLTLWAIFGSATIAYWLHCHELGTRLAHLELSLRSRDAIGLQASLVAFRRASPLDHFQIHFDSRTAYEFLQACEAIAASSQNAADGRWNDVRSDLSETSIEARIQAASFIRLSDRKQLTEVCQAHRTAAEHYLGLVTDASGGSPYRTQDVSARIFDAINGLNANPAAVLVALSDLARLSANCEQDSLDSRIRDCLLDTMTLGAVGLISVYPEISVNDPLLLEQLKLASPAGANTTHRIKTTGFLDAIVHSSFHLDSVSDLVESISAKWTYSDELVYPHALLRNNLLLLRRARAQEFESLERVFESADGYFADELAIVRSNMAIVSMRHAPLPPKDYFEDLFARLKEAPKDRLYTDGVLEVEATWRMICFDDPQSIELLRELAQCSAIFQVRVSAARTLMRYYATKRRRQEFRVMRERLLDAMDLKGALAPRTSFRAALEFPMGSAEWYFISLPGSKRYWPFYPTPVSGPVA